MNKIKQSNETYYCKDCNVKGVYDIYTDMKIYKSIKNNDLKELDTITSYTNNLRPWMYDFAIKYKNIEAIKILMNNNCPSHNDTCPLVEINNEDE